MSDRIIVEGNNWTEFRLQFGEDLSHRWIVAAECPIESPT